MSKFLHVFRHDSSQRYRLQPFVIFYKNDINSAPNLLRKFGALKPAPSSSGYRNKKRVAFYPVCELVSRITDVYYQVSEGRESLLS
jgi:hypothetical protein